MLIKFKPEASETDRQVLRSELGAALVTSFQSGAEQWRLPGSVSVAQAIQQVQDDPMIDYVEPDWFITQTSTLPVDQYFPQQWSMYNTGQLVGSSTGVVGADIKATLAWDISTGIVDPNQRPIVAVIDVGIDYGHPDLAANMWTNAAELTGAPFVDDDNNHFTDDIYGYDFRDIDADPYSDAQFRQGHGTHVAGIIGAVGKLDPPSDGVAGINWKARIMALKIFTSIKSEQKALIADATKAVDYARTMGAKVINASWDIDPNCSSPCARTLEDAIRDAGKAEILFVAAVGEESGTNLDDGNPVSRRFPASYTLDNIIAVTSTDNRDLRPNTANYGSGSVDLGAPGTGIYSTVPRQKCDLVDCMLPPEDCPPPTYSCTPQFPYDQKSGTSMAAPHVAGVAALLWAIKPGMPALSVKARILNSVDQIPSLSGKTVTGGRLNAYQAVYPQDSHPPAQVTNLAAQNSPTSSVTLTWTAPADDSPSEPATFYELRYSTTSITAETFTSATRFWGVVKPSAPGTTQTTTVTGLVAYTAYYFALKAVDDWGNAAPMSNVVTAQACNMCATSFCKLVGEDVFKRCTYASACGSQGCCVYTCVVDETCTAADPCPLHACADACN